MSLFEAYQKIISDNTNAQDAADYMTDFYKKFNQPDILLITDQTSAHFIEANAMAQPGGVEVIKRVDNFFASTNHFRLLPGAVQYKKNHSTYLRLEKAEAILEKDTDIQGVVNVLKDQYFGESVMSICRVNKIIPPQEQPYFTQATAIFCSDSKSVNCAYQINGNPRTNKFTFIHDIFGEGAQQPDIPVEEIGSACGKMFGLV